MTHAAPPGAKTVIVKCARCGDPFRARVADRARGWGKFCSKSCKAIKQTRRTGYSGPRSSDALTYDDYLDTVHPGSDEALGQGEYTIR